MKLKVDTIAPEFETEDVFGKPISLKTYAGKLLLLSFFRNGACAMCNLRLHHLIQRYPDYHSRGLELLAIFETPRASILTNVTKQNAPFPIVADDFPGDSCVSANACTAFHGRNAPALWTVH